MTGYGFQSFPKNIFNSSNWEMIKSFLIKQKKYARYSFSTPSKKKTIQKTAGATRLCNWNKQCTSM